MKSRVPRETGTSGGIAERSFLDSDVCVDEREKEPTRGRERERGQTRLDNLTSYDAGELHLRRLAKSAGLTLRSDIGITRNTRKLSLARRYLQRVLLHRDIIDGIIRANVRLLRMPDFEAIISNCRGSRSQRSLQAEKQACVRLVSIVVVTMNR